MVHSDVKSHFIKCSLKVKWCQLEGVSIVYLARFHGRSERLEE